LIYLVFLILIFILLIFVILYWIQVFIFFYFILVIIGYIIIHSKIPKPTLKAIGQIGTGVLATLGGIDTGLSLYDRGKEYLESKK